MRETQNFGKEKEILLGGLKKYIEPERLKRIEKIPTRQLDILLFLFDEGRINLGQIKDLFSYAKSLSEPEGYIPYAERRRRDELIKNMKEEERRRRSEPPSQEEMLKPEEVKALLAQIFR